MQLHQAALFEHPAFQFPEHIGSQRIVADEREAEGGLGFVARQSGGGIEQSIQRWAGREVAVFCGDAASQVENLLPSG